jgi:DNA polymerase I-like protein with 3'-5' exonuclease and polymerase domains
MEAEYPDIRGGLVAIDSETKDIGLAEDRGPGWAWKGGGEVLGYSITTEEFKQYYAFGHIEGNNADQLKTTNYIENLLKNPDVTPIFANAMYDLGWLRRTSGFFTKRKVHDVLIMAPLVDELKYSYSLDNLSLEYLDKRKDESELDKYAAERGWKDVKSRMKDIPGHVAAKYATTDTDLTLELFKYFMPKMIEDNLLNVYDLETKLIPLLLEMRWNGVRVDLEGAVRLGKKYFQLELDTVEEVRKLTKVNIELTKTSTIAPALEAVGIKCPLTPKTGKPSIKNEWLDTLEHPIAKKIARARKFQKARRTFIENGVIDHAVDGRIHASFNQLKAEREEDGKSTGSVGGRFSSTEPNLQQIPARDPEIGPDIRSLYLPEVGELWGSLDYSSQEPRVMVHFSELAEKNGAQVQINRAWKNITGAVDFAEMYRQDPKMDFHEKTRDAVRTVLPGFERKPAKIIGLGLAYGMGGGKLARSLGLPSTMRFMYGKEVEVAGPEAQVVLNAFDKGVPFLKLMAKYCSKVAKERGYIHTPTGRRFRFPMIGKERMFLHKAFNRLVQGTSACMMKTAMVTAYETENFVPLVTVHDELGISYSDEVRLNRLVDIMQTAFPLNVPILVDVASGKTWGEAM